MTFAADLYLHELTRRQCEAYLADPPHGILLHGESGTGLTTLARALANAINDDPGSLQIVTTAESKDITIDQIRALYHDTRAARESWLTVVLDDAENMNIAAQNAFLKLLEEPPSRVRFILTTHSPNLLLPTIRSRTQPLEAKRLDMAATNAVLNDLGVTDTTMQSQLRFLASGRPAEIIRLVRDSDYFTSQAATMRSAREIIQGSPYQRLTRLRDAMNDRESALQLLVTMGNVISYSAGRGAGEPAFTQLEAITDAIEHLQANGNVRLELLQLALKM